MEKPPFQFGLKDMFTATVSAAALLAIIHYVPSELLATTAAIVFSGILLAVGAIVAARLFVAVCLAIGDLFQNHKPPDA